MLYLVHHGDAVGPEIDPARPLSTRGRVEVDILAEKAAERGVKPAVIWHSGKLRARQTAEGFWRRCNPLSTLTAARGLQPSDPTALIIEALAFRSHCIAAMPEGSALSEQSDSTDIMLVGHFPHMPRLLARLLTGDADAPPADFPLNGMVALEEVDGRWVEKWRLE